MRHEKLTFATNDISKNKYFHILTNAFQLHIPIEKLFLSHTSNRPRNVIINYKQPIRSYLVIQLRQEDNKSELIA